MEPKTELRLRTWIEQEPKDPQDTQTTPLKKIYLEITTTPATMPRNTAVSKAATGPANTLDSEIAIASNP